MQEKTHTESQRHRDDLRLGLCPRPRKRANHRRLTGVRGMGWNPISKSSTFSTLLHGQTYDLQIKPPMLCVSVTLCETPLPACGWRVRGGSETVVKRHLRAVGVPVSSAGARKWVNSSLLHACVASVGVVNCASNPLNRVTRPRLLRGFLVSSAAIRLAPRCQCMRTPWSYQGPNCVRKSSGLLWAVVHRAS